MELTKEELELLKVCLLNNMVLEKRNKREDQEQYQFSKQLLERIKEYETKNNYLRN